MSALRSFWNDVVGPAPSGDDSGNTGDSSADQPPPPDQPPPDQPPPDQPAPDQSQAPVLQSMTISPADSSIVGGGQQQFNAGGTFSDGTCQDMTSTVTWSSSAPDVVSIDSSGLASAQPVPGTATITATDPNSGISASADVTVTAGDTPQQCIQTVYVQQGCAVTLPDDFEPGGHKMVEWGEHGTEIAVDVFHTAQEIHEAGSIIGGLRGALGANLIGVGILLITLESDPDPDPLPCPEMCPWCVPNASPAPAPKRFDLRWRNQGVSREQEHILGQCALDIGHADQHVCNNNHTWIVGGPAAARKM